MKYASEAVILPNLAIPRGFSYVFSKPQPAHHRAERDAHRPLPSLPLHRFAFGVGDAQLLVGQRRYAARPKRLDGSPRSSSINKLP